MIVSIIVAMAENKGIGLGGKLPWHLTDDLKLFKRITMGHYLLIGRKTWESIARPLPGRQMVVITRKSNYHAQGCEVAHSLQEALTLAYDAGETEVFIGGGADLFAEALPVADRIYLTEVHAVVEADTFFPDFDRSRFRETDSRKFPASEGNDHTFTQLVLKKYSPANL